VCPLMGPLGDGGAVIGGRSAGSEWPSIGRVSWPKERHLELAAHARWMGSAQRLL